MNAAADETNEKNTASEETAGRGRSAIAQAQGLRSGEQRPVVGKLFAAGPEERGHQVLDGELLLFRIAFLLFLQCKEDGIVLHW